MNLFTKIKCISGFTESEQIFAQFILEHPYDVIQLNINQLSKSSYVSTSTIYRVIEKLDLSGLNQLKLQVSLSLQNEKKNDSNIDYNYPFTKLDSHHQIMEQMLSLYDQTLKSTFNLIDLDIFLKVVQALYNAQNIYLFPSVGNYFMAESFQQNMLEIGVKVDVIKEHYYRHWHSQLCNKNDLVIIITYASKTENILDIAKELKEKGICTVLISSTIDLPIAQYVDYHLFFSSYEDSEEKIASFSSRISLQYLLDCLYACYFNRDYEKNLAYKIKNYID